MITVENLTKLYGPSTQPVLFAPHLAEACAAYSINTPKRVAAFLAQVGHESGRLQYVCELWGPTPAQVKYEGRKDLGNNQSGDGKRFMGRGLIQVTGRNNYNQMRELLLLAIEDVPDFISYPHLLEQPDYAAWSAAAFWDSRNLNPLADAQEFDNITRRVNGGQNGRDDRRKLWLKAKGIFGDLS